MSIFLENHGVGPQNVKVKTRGQFGPKTILFGEYEFSMEDFLTAAKYILTNTDLEGADDPRLEFARDMNRIEQVEGWDQSRKRFIFRSQA